MITDQPATKNVFCYSLSRSWYVHFAFPRFALANKVEYNEKKKCKKETKFPACSVKCMQMDKAQYFFAKSYSMKQEKSHRGIVLKRDFLFFFGIAKEKERERNELLWLLIFEFMIVDVDKVNDTVNEK